MGTKIKKDFQPDANSYALVAKHGAIKEFCDDQLDHFRSYWLETGKTKASWQATWQVWMRRAWQGKCGTDWEKSRHYRTQGQGSSTGNPFEAVLANLKPGETPPLMSQPAPVYQIKEIPKDSPSMSSEDAFAELKSMGLLK